MAYATLIVFTITHLIEGYVVSPLIEKRMVSMPPALLILGQVLFGALLGPVGIIFATPLVIIVIILVQMIYVEDALGDRVTPLGEENTG